MSFTPYVSPAHAHLAANAGLGDERVQLFIDLDDVRAWRMLPAGPTDQWTLVTDLRTGRIWKVRRAACGASSGCFCAAFAVAIRGYRKTDDGYRLVTRAVKRDLHDLPIPPAAATPAEVSRPVAGPQQVDVSPSDAEYTGYSEKFIASIPEKYRHHLTERREFMMELGARFDADEAEFSARQLSARECKAPLGALVEGHDIFDSDMTDTQMDAFLTMQVAVEKAMECGINEFDAAVNEAMAIIPSISDAFDGLCDNEELHKHLNTIKTLLTARSRAETVSR